MIVTNQLTKRFDDFTAVDQITLEVQRGELLALLGPNGAGKTTTVRMLSAILSPTEGTASVAGLDVVEDADKVRMIVGMLTEQPGLYSRSTGLEYLTFFGRLYGMSDSESKEKGLALFDRFAMPDTAHRRLGEYSKGMRQKVGLIRSMLHDPQVLLLDEPTSAMDPHSAKLVRDAILELRNDHRTIIICTHNLVEAELLADRIAIISYGALISLGSAGDLKREVHGQHRYEITIDQNINGQVEDLDQIVLVDYCADNVIRFRTDDPMIANPQLVRLLTNRGLGIVSLRELSVSLEDVYLSVVSDEDNDSHQN
jgi:ABC-2 type transport system ATP-binding protein